MKRFYMVALSGVILSTSAFAQDLTPIKIVAPVDLSGAAADVGRDSLAGTQFAIEKINREGGVLGRKLMLVHQDSGSNPQRAVNQATALLEEHKAPFMMSPQSSATALAVSKAVTSKKKVPTCFSTSAAEELTIKDFNPYIFSLTPNANMEGRAQAQRYGSLPYKRYALVSADYAGGRSLLEGFKKALKETNPSIEFVVEEFPKFGATDYTPTINKILAAKPDYVFTVLFGNDLITFAKQATAVDFFKQINNRFGALYDFNTLKTMGDQAPVGTDGVQRAPANYLIKNNPEAASFIADYKSKKGGYPSDWTIMSYDCVNTWAQAANSAKSLNADEVMRAIETLQFNSARGPFKIRSFDHQAEIPVYIGKVKQSSEFAQPIIDIEVVIPASQSLPSQAEVLKLRGGK